MGDGGTGEAGRQMIRSGVAVLAAAACAAGADTVDVLRCSGGLVDPGMTAGEVVATCGEPASKVVEQVPVRVRRPNGFVQEIGTTQVERWTYDRGYGQFPALLTFEDGELRTIELLTGR